MKSIFNTTDFQNSNIYIYTFFVNNKGYTPENWHGSPKNHRIEIRKIITEPIHLHDFGFKMFINTLVYFQPSIQKDISSSNHQFSGDILVFRGLYIVKQMSHEKKNLLLSIILVV